MEAKQNASQFCEVTNTYLFTYRLHGKKKAIRISLHGWMFVLKYLVSKGAIDRKLFAQQDPVKQFLQILKRYDVLYLDGDEALVGIQRQAAIIGAIMTDHGADEKTKARAVKMCGDYGVQD